MDRGLVGYGLVDGGRGRYGRYHGGRTDFDRPGVDFFRSFRIDRTDRKTLRGNGAIFPNLVQIDGGDQMGDVHKGESAFRGQKRTGLNDGRIAVIEDASPLISDVIGEDKAAIGQTRIAEKPFAPKGRPAQFEGIGPGDEKKIGPARRNFVSKGVKFDRQADAGDVIGQRSDRIRDALHVDNRSFSRGPRRKPSGEGFRNEFGTGEPQNVPVGHHRGGVINR